MDISSYECVKERQLRRHVHTPYSGPHGVLLSQCLKFVFDIWPPPLQLALVTTEVARLHESATRIQDAQTNARHFAGCNYARFGWSVST